MNEGNVFPMHAAALERLLANCRTTGMTILIDVDPESLPGTDPVTLKVVVLPGHLHLGIRFDYLKDAPGVHADGPLEICPKHDMVLAMEARPDRSYSLVEPRPVTVTWEHAKPKTDAVDVPALVKDHVRLGAELRELSGVHETLLEAILQNADEDINGGDEAAEYLAEAYVRFLEGQVSDYQQRLRDTDQAFAAYRTAHDTGDGVIRAILEAICARLGVSLDSEVDSGPARNYELADRLGIGQVFGLGDDGADNPSA